MASGTGPRCRWRGLIGQSKGEAGFTLMELIITIVLIGIITSIVGVMMTQSMAAFLDSEIRSRLTNEGRLAAERMARDIRMIRSRTAADIPTMTAATLGFVDVNGEVVTFTSGAGVVTRNAIPLASANSVTLTFSYYQPDETAALLPDDLWSIQVDLTFQEGSESQHFRVRSHPRNF